MSISVSRNQESGSGYFAGSKTFQFRMVSLFFTLMRCLTMPKPGTNQ